MLRRTADFGKTASGLSVSVEANRRRDSSPYKSVSNIWISTRPVECRATNLVDLQVSPKALPAAYLSRTIFLVRTNEPAVSL